MGQAIPVIKVLTSPLSDCAKYVCHSCHVTSKCSDCCEMGVETNETSQPYRFLYIDLLASSLEQSFYRSFEARLVPGSSS